MVDKSHQSLAGITVLSSLAPERRAELERRCRWHQYHKGESIIDRESDARDVFFVVSGLVRVVNYSVSGRVVAFDEIGTGGCFGEMAALDGSPRSADVEAVKDTITASLTPDPFLELATANPGVALAMMRRLTSVIRLSTHRVMDLSTLGANNRVYAEILRLAGGPDATSPVMISPFPHHEDIASRVATARETVVRAITALKRRQVVRDFEDKDGLEVLDVEKLADIVHEFRE